MSWVKKVFKIISILYIQVCCVCKAIVCRLPLQTALNHLFQSIEIESSIIFFLKEHNSCLSKS